MKRATLEQAQRLYVFVGDELRGYQPEQTPRRAEDLKLSDDDGLASSWMEVATEIIYGDREEN